MKTEKLIDTLESNGLHPIRVVFNKSKDPDIFVAGDLDYFIQSIKALGETIVFVDEYIFDESYFHHEVDSEVYGEYGDKSEENEAEEDSPSSIYLPAILNPLDGFKNHIGETAIIGLTVFFREKKLGYIHSVEWYAEFETLCEEAIVKFEEREKELRDEVEKSRASLEEAKKKQEKVLIERLKKLVNDRKFAKLGTQRAMQTYALEAIQELDELDPDILKAEIQSLSDRIKAKKLLAE